MGNDSEDIEEFIEDGIFRITNSAIKMAIAKAQRAKETNTSFGIGNVNSTWIDSSQTVNDRSFSDIHAAMEKRKAQLVALSDARSGKENQNVDDSSDSSSDDEGLLSTEVYLLTPRVVNRTIATPQFVTKDLRICDIANQHLTSAVHPPKKEYGKNWKSPSQVPPPSEPPKVFHESPPKRYVVKRNKSPPNVPIQHRLIRTQPDIDYNHGTRSKNASPINQTTNERKLPVTRTSSQLGFAPPPKHQDSPRPSTAAVNSRKYIKRKNANYSKMKIISNV